MKNEKLTTGRLSINGQRDFSKDLEKLITLPKGFKLVTEDHGQERPIIIGRMPGIGRHELMHTRLNWGERTVIAIPIERNRDGSHNVKINLDFDLPMASVRISESEKQ